MYVAHSCTALLTALDWPSVKTAAVPVTPVATAPPAAEISFPSRKEKNESERCWPLSKELTDPCDDLKKLRFLRFLSSKERCHHKSMNFIAFE